MNRVPARVVRRVGMRECTVLPFAALLRICKPGLSKSPVWWVADHNLISVYYFARLTKVVDRLVQGKPSASILPEALTQLCNTPSALSNSRAVRKNKGSSSISLSTWLLYALSGLESWCWDGRHIAVRPLHDTILAARHSTDRY